MADGIEVGHGHVTITASARDAVRQINRDMGAAMPKLAQDSGKRFSGAFGAALKAGIAGAVAAIGVVAAKGIGESISAAGDLEQSIGGAQAVFKGYAKNIDTDSKKAATSVGLSQNAFNELATTLGSTLKNKGVKDFGKSTETLIGLGSDLSAQFGGSTKDAVDALSSALRGETDPIERYGVSMNQTAIQAEAMRLGLAKTTKDTGKITAAQLRAEVAQTRYNKAVKEHGKNSTEAKTAQAGLVSAQGALSKAMGGSKVELTDQQKAMAALSLISRQTKDAQGAFGRETDTLAHKQQVAAAQWDNLKAKMGGIFLPIATKVMGFISEKMLPAFDRLANFLTKNAGPAFERLSATVGPILKTVSLSVGAFFAAFREGDVTSKGVVGFAERVGVGFRGLIPAIQSVVAWAQTRLVPAFLGIVGAGQRLGAVVLPIIRQIAARFLQEWPKIQPIVAGIFQTIGGIVVDYMGIIKKVVESVTTIIQLVWSKRGQEIMTIVGSLFKVILNIIGGTLKIVGGIVKLALALITGDWGKARQAIGQIVAGLKQIVVGVFNNMRTILDAVLRSTITALVNKWNGFLTYTKTALRLQLARVKDYVLTPVRAARDALKGVLDGISSRFSSAVAAIGRAWDGLKEKAKAPVRFVVDTVLNNGLIAAFNKIAGVVGASGIPRLSLPPGFHEGGPPGGIVPGGRGGPRDNVLAVDALGMPRYRVEGDEWVGPRWMSPLFPALEQLRRAGRGALKGFAGGGLTGGSGRFTDRFASVLEAAQRMLGLHFSIFQRGFRPATSYSGTSHAGDAVDLGPVTARVVAVLRSLGVAAWRRGPAQGFTPHIHGIPLPGRGSAGGSGIWQAQDYLRGGDGLGGRDYEARGGVLAKIGAFLKSGFASFTAWLRDLFKDPLAKLGQITDSPFGQLAARIPHMVAEGMVNKVKGFAGGGIAPPGWSMAGERGRELIYTPGGSRVFPNGQTERMLAGGPRQIEGVVYIEGTGMRGYVKGILLDETAAAGAAF